MNPAPMMSTPHNHEAEQAVLGAVLHDNRQLRSLRGVLGPEHFFAPAHRDIFTAMLALANDAKPVDEMTLFALLRGQSKLTSCGGGVYIAELFDLCPVASHAMFYAEIVYGHWRERESMEGARNVLESFGTVKATQSFSERLKSLESRAFHQQTVSAKDGVTQLFTALESEGGKVRFLRTYSPIDDYVAGLEPGFISVIAARPGEGKTTLAGQIAMRNALAGEPTLFVTMEMRNQGLMARMTANKAGVDSGKLIHAYGDLTDGDWDRLSVAAGEMAEAPLRLHGDGRRLTLEQIRAAVADDVTQHGTRLVVVDHLRLIRAPGKDIYERQTSAVTGLGDVAKEFDVVMLVCAQLNRQGVNEPRLENLEGSGAIEQDADTVLILSAPWDTSGGDAVQRKDELLCRIIKCRNGKTGALRLSWCPEYARIGKIN